MGCTATPKTGKMGVAITAHLGEPKIISKQEGLQPKIEKLVYKRTLNIDKDKADTRQFLPTLLSRLKERNQLLADIIYIRGVRRGRQCLGLSDRTDQLVDIRGRLIHYGVPANDIGLYVGGYRQYGRMVKPSKAEYERIEKECPIILATYGIFDTGIDISRLDWGIECTPRGDVTQALGRVLRLYPGKSLPEWVSIIDELLTFAPVTLIGKTIMQQQIFATPLRLAKQREASYLKQNAKVTTITDALHAIAAQKAKILAEAA